MENHLVSHFQKIPECLSQFEVSSSRLSIPAVNGAPLYIERYIRCLCGSENLMLEAAQRKELKGVCSKSEVLSFKPPVYAICPVCARTTLLFDREIHGWSAEFDLVRGAESTVTLAKCAPQPGRIRVAYTYQDTPVYDQLLEKGVMNIEDYFDSFGIFHQNSSGGDYTKILACRCA